MRIKGNIYDDYESYSCALREQVAEVFQYVSQITTVKRLLYDIKKESLSLRKLFWTEEELKKRKESLSFFDARMQATVYYTLKNIEGYKQSGWKELIDEGENSDERINSIQKEK
ncbi:hypothetical protein [Brassicibacter mesophilus]|uniref:hypothetical protein n=1 Tax=Brassicibacter mesophilus TaxID=745119 RepID=UPI003D251593